MLDLHYDHPVLASIYDLSCGWDDDRDFYLNLAPKDASISILDLGCGTGLLCREYAKRGHRVTGLDPSLSMLAAGKNESFGDKVTWENVPAQDFKLDSTFDLIIMTGHAFQVILREADLRSTFTNVHDHLSEGGTFVFESRNPRVNWQEKWHGKVIEYDSSYGPVRESYTVTSNSSNLIDFTITYKILNETLNSYSTLRFWSQSEIERLVTEQGLYVKNFHGEWNGDKFNPSSSEEMIYHIARRTGRETGR